MLLPDVYFGENVDWRKRLDESPDDDSDLDPTPSDVVGMLGFDPAKDLE